MFTSAVFTSCLLLSGLAQAQDLVINEVLFNPRAVADTYGEWFELYNPGSEDVDIEGWTIADDDFDRHVIASGGPLLVPAGGYLVLGSSTEMALNGGVEVAYAWGTGLSGGFALGNAGDEIALYDADGELRDWMRYTSAWRAGWSLELLHPGWDNAELSSWTYATTAFGEGDLGTPGWANAGLLSTEEQVDSISDVVEELAADGSLSSGQANALQSKLDAILARIESGNLRAAENQLRAFENQVVALLASGAISQEQADALLEQVDLLWAMLAA